MEDAVVNLQHKALQSKRHILCIDGTIVVAYNADKPYTQLVTEPKSTRLRHQHLPTYESINIPYLCAAPATPDYSGAVLGRLKQMETQYPIIFAGGKYKLEPSLADSWLRLENTLEDLAQLLISSAQPFVPVDYQFPAPPSSFGFLQGFESRYGAMVAVQRSRDAFQGLVAHAAWGAILHRAKDMTKLLLSTKDRKDRKSPYDISREDTTVFDVGWQCQLANPKLGIHPAWIEAIAHSPIGDFSIPRAGIVIRTPKDWPFLNLIPCLVLSNVPIWLIWGKLDVPASLTLWPAWAKKNYGPTAFESMRAVCASTAVPSPAIGSEGSDLGHNRIAVKKKTTYSWPDVHAWILKKKDYIAKKIEQSTPEQQLKYAQRQSEAATFRCPGKQGAVVYEWDRDNQSRPTRTVVLRGEVQWIWPLYTDKQRWYNCIAHEWELCHELAPDDVPENDPYSDCSDSDRVDGTHADNDYLNLPLTGGWRKKSIALNVLNIRIDFTDLLPPPSELHSESFNTASNVGEVRIDAMLLLSQRFGFSHHREASYQPVSKMQWTLTKALRVIGDSKEKNTYKIRDGLEAAAIQFMMHLDSVGHPDMRIPDIPSSLCDIYGENHCPLIWLKSSVFIQTISDGNCRLYIIHHEQDKDRPWLLAVADPCTALQAVRSDPPTLDDFVLSLIYAMTPFRTLRKAESTGTLENWQPHKYSRRRIGLGRRSPGHKLDKADYIVYKAERARLLESRRVSRAAIKRGGIISRLVHGNVDDCYILNGPSPEAIELPFIFTTSQDGEQVTYYDDDISAEEISILVGLYSIKSDKGAAPSEESWWPTAGKFEDSGLNIGVWTPKCEEWYQKRRKGIIEETHGTCNASHWRTYLRFEGETKRVLKGASTLAARYIASNYGVRRVDT